MYSKSIINESGVYMPHPNVKGHFAYVTDTKIANNKVYTKGSYVELCIEDEILRRSPKWQENT